MLPSHEINSSRRFYYRELPVFALLFALGVVFFFGVELISGIRLFENVGNDQSYYFAYYPFLVKYQRMLGEGYFPLWWASSGLGLPMLGAWSLAAFFPLLIPFLPFEFLEAANVFVLSRIWLMGLTAYLFARKALSISPYGAAIAAVTFAFSGFSLDRLLTAEMNVPWLIPLFAYAMGEQVPRPRWNLMVVAGFAGATAILAGHPPQAFYMFFFGGAWWLYRWTTVGRFRFEGAVGPASAVVLSMLIAAAQILPGVEVIASFPHSHPVDPHINGYPSRGAFSLIMPWLAGTQKSNALTVLLMPYFGLIPVFLALFGLSQLRRLKRESVFPAAYLFLFTGLAFNLPLFRLWKYLPGFNRLANHVNAMPTIALCAGLSAGMALDLVLRDDVARRKFSRFLPLVSVMLIMIAGYGLWLIRFLTGQQFLNGFLPPESVLREQWLNQVLVAVLLIAALFIIIRLYGRLRPAVSGSIIVILTFMGLWIDHFGWNTRDPGAYELVNGSRAVAALKDYIRSSPERSLDRVTSDYVPLNLTWLPGFSDIRSVSVFQHARYSRLMARVNGLDIERSEDDYKKFMEILKEWFYLPFPPDKMNTPAGNLLGIRFGIAAPGSGSGVSDLKVFYSGDDAIIYENVSAGPRAFIAGGWRVFNRARDVLDFMINEPGGWENTALFAIEDYPGIQPWDTIPETIEPIEEAGCEIVFYRDQAAIFDVTAPSPSFVVETDLYMPGWKAEVNGAPARIYIADYLVRAVAVPEGSSRVRIWYEPASFAIGLWATLATLFFIALAGMLKYFIKQRL